MSRRSPSDWLLCRDGLVALANLVFAIGLCALYYRIADRKGEEWMLLRLAIGLALLAVIWQPLVYFGGPLVMLLVIFVLAGREEKSQFPCPVCGYDIRATPHRCPECGTVLQWGNLPDKRRRRRRRGATNAV